MTETVRFERRYQGFEDGALGGYAAGVAARGIAGPAEANLRSLPPMEHDLQLREGENGGVELWDGETLVLDARPAKLDMEVPDPPSQQEALEAAQRPIHEEGKHLYPSCFTCGPDREKGDGLRLFMGRHPEGAPSLASAWTPDERLAHGTGSLPSELVWAALDCPTIWAAWATSNPAAIPSGSFTVLARQRLAQPGTVPVGETVTVTAWPIEQEGRKHLSGAAIHGPDGTLLACAESLLVEVPRATA
jgi:hypothetical protein